VACAGSTGLDQMVAGSTDIIVVGVALGFCVGSTSLDSFELGFQTTLLMGMTKPVNDDTDASEGGVSWWMGHYFSRVERRSWRLVS
jgi:nicotinamidase-related amidase